ncbi:MAG TPA: hypothetical protein VFY90_09150 [Tepidiformaceae bacterium]|nr:hypothetical protein [Tepidiformaceae bacterium]
MKLLVLGNSDYNGSLMEDSLQSWPHLVGERLGKELGMPVEVVNLNLVPSRRSVLTEVEDLIQEHRPELVVVGLNPYSFAVRTVATRVRQRFGARAAKTYTRLEHAFDRRTHKGRVRTALNRTMRAATRRTIGVAPLAPVEQIIETYRAVFARLSREEQLQAVVMGGSKLSLRYASPAVLAQVDRFRVEMKQAAEAHHFAFFDTEQTVVGPDRESYFMPDGVHRNERGHERLAEMVYPVVAAELARLGLAPAGSP